MVASSQETKTVQECYYNNFPQHRRMSRKRKASQSQESEGHEISENIQQHVETIRSEPVHFYLHRPDVPAKYRCLIPLAPDSTIADAVRDHMLLEFPTIFALDTAPSRLEQPYITEEEYEKQHDNTIPIDLPAFNYEDNDQGLSTNLDEKSLLEVLRKDISG